MWIVSLINHGMDGFKLQSMKLHMSSDSVHLSSPIMSIPQLTRDWELIQSNQLGMEEIGSFSPKWSIMSRDILDVNQQLEHPSKMTVIYCFEN